MQTATQPPASGTKKYTVFISYNGLPKPFEVVGSQTVRSLLEKAMDVFGVQQNRHIQALYPVGGSELPDNVSLSEAGVHADAELQLRPSAVKGGAAAAGPVAW